MGMKRRVNTGEGRKEEGQITPSLFGKGSRDHTILYLPKIICNTCIYMCVYKYTCIAYI